MPQEAKQPFTDPTKIPVGSKLPVLKVMDNESFWREGELLAVRVLPGSAGRAEFYIHYTNFNKRLDEWVAADRLDLASVKVPSSSGQGAAGSAGSGKGGAGSGQDGKMKGSHGAGPRKDKRTKKQPQPTLLQIQRESSTADESTNVSGSGEPAQEVATAKTTELEHLRRGGSMTSHPEEIHLVKNINFIQIGRHKIETWYFSPYPPELVSSDCVYICEFCLSFFDGRTRFGRHREKCQLYHPPGNEIYRKDDISFFEIDGNRQKTYCRNLCLLSKLFLDHKTLYYDTNPFLFYVMTANDELGHHIVGYFSKEKESLDNYNVACILTLPNHQRKGYGRLLINFSYELSKKEGKLGSPEKPLSDLGLLSYRTYWSEVLLNYFFNTMDTEISIEDLCMVTSMTNEDVVHTLQHLDLLRYYNGQYVVVLNDRHREMHEKTKSKLRKTIDSKALDWTPPVFLAHQLRYI